MKFALLMMPLITLSVILFNPGIASAWQGQPVPDGVRSVENSSAVMDVSDVEEVITHPTQIVPLLQQEANPTTLPVALVSPTQVATATSALTSFVASVKNGEAGQVVGVYVPKILALHVTQQPLNDPAYVNASADYTTQFRLAANYGTIGLLAHNYLSGALFFNLSVGQEVDIIYGNGIIKRYAITALRHFQALRPTDPASNFVDIDNNSGTQISNADVFHQIYTGNRVVFQTCINAHGNASWGRLFVIATPMP